MRECLLIAKPGDTLEWCVISVEPEQHRLGLSLKAPKEKTEEPKAEELKPKDEEIGSSS